MTSRRNARMQRWRWPLALALAAAGPSSTGAQTAAQLTHLQAEVSIANIEASLHAIDVDRTAASNGERAAAAYLDRTLTSYHVAHRALEAHVLAELARPGRADASRSLPVMTGKTAAFAAPTPASRLA